MRPLARAAGAPIAATHTAVARTFIRLLRLIEGGRFRQGGSVTTGSGMRLRGSPLAHGCCPTSMRSQLRVIGGQISLAENPHPQALGLSPTDRRVSSRRPDFDALPNSSRPYCAVATGLDFNAGRAVA